MELKHLIDFSDLSVEQWDDICTLATEIKKAPERFSGACHGKIMATLFYEPSTRTQLSFQTAMMRLGGKTIGFSDPNSSSVSKGETLADTVKIISCYADITVIRNPIEGAAYAASLYSKIPIVNAGDGGHLHPTQTMTDLFTIKEKFNRYDNLTFGICGDLLNGRTVHSLLKALVRYKNNTVYLISTPKLSVPNYIKEILDNANVEYHEVDTIESCIDKLDVLYMTRIQRERFSSNEEYVKQSGVYRLTADKMALAKKDMIVLHPLPKVDEIAYDVDDDPRALYFEQAQNGMFVRMALILTLCNKESRFLKDSGTKYEKRNNEFFCSNPKCISNHEKYLPQRIITKLGKSTCAYCDADIKG